MKWNAKLWKENCRHFTKFMTPLIASLGRSERRVAALRYVQGADAGPSEVGKYGGNMGSHLIINYLIMRCDPILSRPNSWNRYAYVENDPINYYDPSGLLVQCPAGDMNCIDVTAPAPDPLNLF